MIQGWTRAPLLAATRTILILAVGYPCAVRLLVAFYLFI